jgi:uncharacterized protein (DUF3084 family)
MTLGSRGSADAQTQLLDTLRKLVALLSSDPEMLPNALALAEKWDEIQAREQALAAGEEAIRQREAELDARAAALDCREAAQKDREAAELRGALDELRSLAGTLR